MTTTTGLDAVLRWMSPAQLRSIVQAGQAKLTLWEGSVSAGKTIASLFALFDAIRHAPTNGLVVIIGKTLQTVYQNVLTVMQSRELFGALAAAVQYTRGAPTARIMGREVSILGANDAKAAGKIQGSTIALAYVDEATLLPPGYWPMLVTRLRVLGARLLATTNPGPRNHWLRKDWILKAQQVGMQVFSFKMDDNPSLSEEYKASMRASFTGIFYDRYILGKWTNAEGAIFDMWDPAKHVIPWASLPKMRRLYAVGVDYGTRNAFAAELLGHGDDGKLYLVDEWCHISTDEGQQRWTDGELSAGLRTWMAGQHLPHAAPRIEWVAVDPSAASFRQQLFYDGMSNVMDADNDVVPGIRNLQTLLASGQMLVSDRCPGWIDEAPGYAWDPVATDQGFDRPIKREDHRMDAGRYAVQSTDALWRPSLVAA